jgi:hypothetical protein
VTKYEVDPETIVVEGLERRSQISAAVDQRAGRDGETAANAKILFTAKHLQARAGAGVHVELISRHNFFVFQPLLSEVAGGSIQPADAVSPPRSFLPGLAVRVSEIRKVDFSAKTVHVTVAVARSQPFPTISW